MTTISVPVSADLETFVNHMVKSGKASNKADVFRRALELLSEHEALEAVLKSEREVEEGKVLRGNLRDLAKKIK